MQISFNMRNTILIFLLFPLLILAQEPYEDFGSWTKIKLKHSLNKKISFTNKTELRTTNNALLINQLYTQFSGRVKINKHFSTSMAWRIKMLNETYGFTYENRLHNDITYKNKISDFNIFLRLRSQLSLNPYSNNEFHERTRFKASYKINKKMSFYLYDELYYKIMDQNSFAFYEKNRFATGIEFRLNKSIDMEVKYIRIRDKNIENPEIMNIMGVVFSLEI